MNPCSICTRAHVRSFKGGVSFGEKLIPPSAYKQQLGTNCNVNE